MSFRRAAVPFLLAVSCILTVFQPSIAQNNMGGDPSWSWPESRWRGIVERVRAGPSLLPESWPNGAKAAVALSFDFDTETISLRLGVTSPSNLSEGEYGARSGIPRILDLLERHEISASFFIPAVSAKLHTKEVSQIATAGHEIGVHGWIHEATSSLARDEELMLMQRSLDTLEEITGKRPVGLRTGSWDFSENTLDLIRELGFLYDSSLMADDIPYEILANGEPTGVVELPVEWILDDFPYFGMIRAGINRPYTPPSGVYEVWASEFDMAYQEGGMFLLTMHPQIIGHRSRISMLERLIQHIKSHPDVWFATHEEIARYVKANVSR